MIKRAAFLDRNHKIVLCTIAAILILLSFTLNPMDENFYWFRVLRPTICFSYLLMFFFSGRKNDLIRSYLIVFAISSLFAVWFHVQWVAIMTLTLEAMALPFLIWMVFPKVKFKNPGFYYSLALGTVASVCALLLVSFVDVISQYLGDVLLLISICILTVEFFVLLILAFIYNSESNTPTSLIFIFFLIFLVFSEMLRAVGYYAFVDPVLGQQIGRVLLIVSHSLLFHFSYLEIKNSHIIRDLS